MKYLKRFNEELKSQTYLSAARKLKKMGNPTSLKRAAVLTDWADETELKETIAKWEKEVEEYSKFGSIRLSIGEGSNIYTGNFYTDFTFDGFAFEDNYEYEKNESVDGNFSSEIYIPVGIIPTTKEGLDKCLQIIDTEYFTNGFFWGIHIMIKFNVVDNERIEFTGMSFDSDGDINAKLTSNAAIKLKELLYRLLTDKSLNYPSSSTEYTNEYDHINNFLCAEMGLSADYGFELKDIADYIQTVDKNTLM